MQQIVVHSKDIFITSSKQDIISCVGVYLSVNRIVQKVLNPLKGRAVKC